MHIRGQTAIVTGASSGLGAATARMLSEGGAKVALFDRNQAAGETLAEELGGHFFRVDVTQESEVVPALDAVSSRYGIARILVNCAGVAPAIKTVSREFIPHPLEDLFDRSCSETAAALSALGTAQNSRWPAFDASTLHGAPSPSIAIA